MKRSCTRTVRWALVLALGIAPLTGCGGAPQLGDEDCLAAADALWTSVTAKDTALLERSASEIEKLHAGARLSDDAFKVLAGVISTARAGEWTEARVTLKSFVRGQRPAPPRT